MHPGRCPRWRVERRIIDLLIGSKKSPKSLYNKSLGRFWERFEGHAFQLVEKH